MKKNINHPCNAFNAEANAHDTYDDLAWGIEAIQVGDEVNMPSLERFQKSNIMVSGNITSAKSALITSLLLSNLEKDRNFFLVAEILQAG